MESQPQNPEFRINPENFHPCEPGTKCTTYVTSDNKVSCSRTQHRLEPGIP